MNEAIPISSSANKVKQLPIKIPNDFEDGAQYLPIAGKQQINGASEPVIGSYTPKAPGSGTFVLGSVDGFIQWIATETCQ